MNEALQGRTANHRQDAWRNELIETKMRIKTLRKRYAAAVEKGRLSLPGYEHDNIPHWRGIVVNDAFYFMGASEWIFATPNYPSLQLGQIEYRRCTIDDPHGGKERIDRFRKWFDSYKPRRQLNIANEPTGGTGRK